jgi:hypothetical protein
VKIGWRSFCSTGGDFSLRIISLPLMMLARNDGVTKSFKMEMGRINPAHLSNPMNLGSDYFAEVGMS